MRIVRSLKAALAATVVAVGAVSGTPAWADRGHGHEGHGWRHHDRGHGREAWALGFGLLAGTALAIAASEPRIVARPAVVYAPPPVVYTPPRIVLPARAAIVVPPPAYVEQDVWHYCAAPAGYYPYVANCPSGWMRVVPPPG